MDVGGKVKLTGELTIVSAKSLEEILQGVATSTMDCDKCSHPLSFDNNGVLVCRNCRPL